MKRQSSGGRTKLKDFKWWWGLCNEESFQRCLLNIFLNSSFSLHSLSISLSPYLCPFSFPPSTFANPPCPVPLFPFSLPPSTSSNITLFLRFLSSSLSSLSSSSFSSLYIFCRLSLPSPMPFLHLSPSTSSNTLTLSPPLSSSPSSLLFLLRLVLVKASSTLI